MKKRMPYWLYKAGYTEFNASEYDAATKTIEVDLPEHKKPRFPKEWVKSGNHYRTPNGCTVTFWESGLAEHFYVQHYVSMFNCPSKDIGPCIDAREQVMAYVQTFN